MVIGSVRCTSNERDGLELNAIANATGDRERIQRIANATGDREITVYAIANATGDRERTNGRKRNRQPKVKHDRKRNSRS